MIVTFGQSVLPYRVKKILRRILRLDNVSTPHSCSLYMTHRCNLKCQGCYMSTIGVKKSNELTVATVQQLLSLYPSIDAFCVAGLGEPTLCSNFVSIVNFLKKNMKFVGIITNGTDSDKFLKLAYTPNYISISLKGYDKESYLAHTGVDTFHKVIKNFKRLQARFKNVGFSYLLNKLNYEDLDKVLLLCDELKPDFLHLTNYLVYDPTVPKEVQKIITTKDSEIIHYINRACASRDYIKIKPAYVDFYNAKFNCSSYDYVINLDGDGNIGGCLRQIPPEASFGNIFTDTDPYNSLTMQNLREHVHNKSSPHKECRYCFTNWQR